MMTHWKKTMENLTKPPKGQSLSHRVFCSGLLLCCTLLAHPVMAKDSLFAPLADSKETDSELRHYTHYDLVTGLNDSRFSTQRLGGKLSRTNTRVSASYTPLNLINNYKKQILAQGGQILFECQLTDCGDTKALSEQIAPLYSVTKNEPALLTATMTLAKKEVYLSLYAATFDKYTRVELDILEVVPEPLDLVSVNTGYLGPEVTAIAVNDNTAKDAQGAHDHPMLARLPGAYISEYQAQGFAKTHVSSAIDNNQHKVEVLEGKLTDILYTVPRSYSEYEVHANYQAALNKLGFTPLFQCQGKACGKQRGFEKNLHALAKIGADENQFYSLYQLKRPAGDIHVMVYIIGYSGNMSAEVRIVEASALDADRVQINLDALTDQIASTGHVALDGLLFEFDSDAMLPEAKAVIDVVASYLKAHPKQAFYVVGHTDDKGQQEYNLTLSEKRAKAVVQSLTQDYQIPRAQLQAKGIGEHAPIASNLSDAGQQQNRRVELVIRSDTQ